MVPQQALLQQTQVSLPELWPWQPEADLPPDYIPDKPGSYRSVAVPVRHGRHPAAHYYFAVLMKCRLSQRYFTPEMSVTAATTQHST